MSAVRVGSSASLADLRRLKGTWNLVIAIAAESSGESSGVRKLETQLQQRMGGEADFLTETVKHRARNRNFNRHRHRPKSAALQGGKLATQLVVVSPDSSQATRGEWEIRWVD
jgi:hypothetical protein